MARHSRLVPRLVPPPTVATVSAGKVTFTTYDKLDKPTVVGDVAGIFVCRSSSWVPPWLDGEFIHLVESLPADETICLDCMAVQNVGAFDACTVREWTGELLVFP